MFLSTRFRFVKTVQLNVKSPSIHEQQFPQRTVLNRTCLNKIGTNLRQIWKLYLHIINRQMIHLKYKTEDVQISIIFLNYLRICVVSLRLTLSRTNCYFLHKIVNLMESKIKSWSRPLSRICSSHHMTKHSLICELVHLTFPNAKKCIPPWNSNFVPSIAKNTVIKYTAWRVD